MPEMTANLLPLLLPTLVGFGIGYGVRELISRREKNMSKNISKGTRSSRCGSYRRGQSPILVPVSALAPRISAVDGHRNQWMRCRSDLLPPRPGGERHAFRETKGNCGN